MYLSLQKLQATSDSASHMVTNLSHCLALFTQQEEVRPIRQGHRTERGEFNGLLATSVVVLLSISFCFASVIGSDHFPPGLSVLVFRLQLDVPCGRSLSPVPRA